MKTVQAFFNYARLEWPHDVDLFDANPGVTMDHIKDVLTSPAWDGRFIHKLLLGDSGSILTVRFADDSGFVILLPNEGEQCFYFDFDSRDDFELSMIGVSESDDAAGRLVASLAEEHYEKHHATQH